MITDSLNLPKEIRSAIKQGDIERVKAFIGSNKEILNYMTPFGTWLHVAATCGNIEIVKYLVDLGLDINIKGGIFNAGAINRAASEGHLDIVSYLISCGAELDVSEPDKNPLFAAIFGGHKEIVQLLIQKGIDIKVKYTGENMKNMDAYSFAIERGQLEIASLIKLSLS
jgi:ankyrin repeat protein